MTPVGYVYLKIDHSFTTHELMISCEPTSAEEWEGIRAWLVRDGQVAFGELRICPCFILFLVKTEAFGSQGGGEACTSESRRSHLFIPHSLALVCQEPWCMLEMRGTLARGLSSPCRTTASHLPS